MVKQQSLRYTEVCHALDNRLSLVASFAMRSRLPTSAPTMPPADLACENGVCRSAIATDIKAGPASIAMKTWMKRRNSYIGKDWHGLQPILPDEVDDIVPAGMGGETIADNNADWLKNPRCRLILQPMTKRDRLLKELLTAGFAIIDERVSKDGDKLYSVICSNMTRCRIRADKTARRVYMVG